MADVPSPSAGIGAPLCEVCAEPIPPGSKALRVGACEFPFHVHNACRERLGPLAIEITQMCSAADQQPEGLLWLGSWDSQPTRGEGEADNAAP